MDLIEKKLSREIISYLIFGVLTTIVNYAAYYGFTRWMGWGVKSATAAAWLLAVLFAYGTNKIWVFQSLSFAPSVILRELGTFISCRLFSGVLDFGMMWLFVDYMAWNDMAVKIGDNVVVVILNYVFSKVWIFNKIHD